MERRDGIVISLMVLMLLLWFYTMSFLHDRANFSNSFELAHNDFHLHHVKSESLKDQRADVDQQKGSADDPVRHSKIYVSVAAFRDRQCQWTLLRAVLQALFPERLAFSVVMQHNSSAQEENCHRWVPLLCGDAPPPSDFLVVGLESRGPVTPDQIGAICAVHKRSLVTRIDFLHAKGPLVARALAQRQLIDTDPTDAFFMQIDSHTHFAAAWDVEAMRNWVSANDSKAVISVYPDGISEQGMRITPNSLFEWPQNRAGQLNGFTRRTMDNFVPARHHKNYPFNPNEFWQPNSRGFICSGHFEPAPCEMVKFNAIRSRPNPGRTFLSAFFGAGFAFTKLATMQHVSYDPHADYVFDGEEFTYTARLWTHGYNMYSPFTLFVWHVYASAAFNLPKYFQNDWNTRWPIQKLAEARLRVALKLPLPTVKCGNNDCSQYPKAELEKYSVGDVRDINDFIRLVGITEWGQKGNWGVCNEIMNGQWEEKLKPYLEK